MEPLDNPVWHALTGPHTEFSEGTGLALRYDRTVSPFAGLPDEPGPEAWSALRTLVGPGGAAIVFRTDRLEAPAGWAEPMRLPTLQMVASAPIGAGDPEFMRLGAGDVDEMLALVKETKPGPFFARTHELGTYIGTREGGKLIAMAGERMRFAGYTEISAVCTDPGARKRGLATRLVRAVAAGLEARGETPILHVLADNSSAIRVYEAIGFTTRAAFDVVMVQAAPAGS
jgi:ribosomal protein S18 acetylase RimI-like enzyme